MKSLISYFKTQYLQKYENVVTTWFLYKIQHRIPSQCPFFGKQFSSPSKMSLNFAICIKMQYLQPNLHQSTITPVVVRWKFVQYFFFLYAFISFTFQGWIRYQLFCSGRTPGALVKTIKYSKSRIILVIPVSNLTLLLTLNLTLSYVLPYLTLP